MHEEVAFSGKRAYCKQIMPISSSFIALCPQPCCYISYSYQMIHFQSHESGLPGHRNGSSVSGKSQFLLTRQSLIISGMRMKSPDH